jgi:homoserine kinase type II
MKNLTPAQVARIAREYSLGKVQSAKYIPAGWSNFSFDLKTNSGRYIAQVMGGDYDSTKGKRLQFRILEHLKKKGYPYAIPFPLKTSEGQRLLKLGDNYLWIYERLEGETDNNPSLQKLKEITKALALYHKAVGDFRGGRKADFNYRWLKSEYDRFDRIKARDKTDRLVLDNLGFFSEVLGRLEEIDYGDNFVMAHADLTGDNVLFDGNKATGVIDFNNLEYAPLANDVAISVFEDIVDHGSLDKRKYETFIAEYQKYNKFSKKDKDLIFPLIMRYYAYIFQWRYAGMKKHLDKRHRYLREDIESTKRFAKMIGWGNERTS